MDLASRISVFKASACGFASLLCHALNCIPELVDVTIQFLVLDDGRVGKCAVALFPQSLKGELAQRVGAVQCRLGEVTSGVPSAASMAGGVLLVVIGNLTVMFIFELMTVRFFYRLVYMELQLSLGVAVHCCQRNRREERFRYLHLSLACVLVVAEDFIYYSESS